jgi:hypothetical protein
LSTDQGAVVGSFIDSLIFRDVLVNVHNTDAIGTTMLPIGPATASVGLENSFLDSMTVVSITEGQPVVTLNNLLSQIGNQANYTRYNTTGNPIFPTGQSTIHNSGSNIGVWGGLDGDLFIFDNNSDVQNVVAIQAGETEDQTSSLAFLDYQGNEYGSIQGFPLGNILIVRDNKIGVAVNSNGDAILGNAEGVIVNGSTGNLLITAISQAAVSANVNSPLVTIQGSYVAATATITNIAIDGSDNLTVTCSNSFTIGQQVTLTGLTTATFLNGVTVTIATQSNTQFMAPFAHALYASAPDTGTAVEVEGDDWVFTDVLGTGTNPTSTLTLQHFGSSGVAKVEVEKPVQLDSSVGFYGTAPQAKPTVTGSKGSNAALANLLTALAGLGLIVDSSS